MEMETAPSGLDSEPPTPGSARFASTFSRHRPQASADLGPGSRGHSRLGSRHASGRATNCCGPPVAAASAASHCDLFVVWHKLVM